MKKKSLKDNNQERFIHVKAVSECLYVSELVPEKKVVRRLEKIRDSFVYLSSRRHTTDTLVVKTCVHNPQIF